MQKSTTPFTAIVLAGDRTSGDPLAEAAGVACKSFVPVGGRPMVLRVLDSLERIQPGWLDHLYAVPLKH